MEFNEIAYSWWNDRGGNVQYFWSGGNDTVHTCQCGLLNSCIDPNLKCNCDALATLNVYDEGEKDHFLKLALVIDQYSSSHKRRNYQERIVANNAFEFWKDGYGSFKWNPYIGKTSVLWSEDN